MIPIKVITKKYAVPITRTAAVKRSFFMISLCWFCYANITLNIDNCASFGQQFRRVRQLYSMSSILIRSIR